MNAWDRLAGESTKAYTAFKIYLETPDRSLQKVAEKLTISRQLISRWAKKFDWIERSAEYDSSLLEQERKNRAAIRAEELKLQHELGMLMAQKALERLKTLDISKISPHATTEMALAATQILNNVAELESSADEADKAIKIKIVRAGDENAGR